MLRSVHFGNGVALGLMVVASLASPAGWAAIGFDADPQQVEHEGIIRAGETLEFSHGDWVWVCPAAVLGEVSLYVEYPGGGAIPPLPPPVLARMELRVVDPASGQTIAENNLRGAYKFIPGVAYDPCLGLLLFLHDDANPGNPDLEYHLCVNCGPFFDRPG